MKNTKKFVDYYKLLGVSIDATESEIKKAYKQKMSIWHPDHNVNCTDKEKVVCLRQSKLLNEAKSVLFSANSREKYNRQYRREQAKKDARLKKNDYTGEFIWGSCFERKYERERKEEELRKEAREKAERLRHEEERRKTEKRVSEVEEACRKIRESRRPRTDTKKHNIIYRTLLNYIIREDDDVVSYILRNGIPTLVISGVIFGSACLIKGCSASNEIVLPENDFETRDSIVTETTVMPEETLSYDYTIPTVSEKIENPTMSEILEDDGTITLTRMHKIVVGDRLSDLSIDSNTTIDEIKRLNNMKSDTVVLNTVLQIPYFVNREDLELYTQVGDVSFAKDLEIVARYYETDLDTLIRLNGDAILEINGSYQTLSENLLVPKFISKDEYRNTVNKTYKK